MIEVIVGTVIYTATLLGCYDGDTCTIKFDNTPDILAEQKLRFKGFDTPEMRGQCPEEKSKARQAKQITIDYMNGYGKVYATGERGKYGRLLVTLPALQDKLITLNLAKPYDGGARSSWCD
jgi:endonuclease YncB( thermonuclease family)